MEIGEWSNGIFLVQVGHRGSLQTVLVLFLLGVLGIGLRMSRAWVLEAVVLSGLLLF